MKIKKLTECEIPQALELVWTVFLEFEAPDYSEQGAETFRKYIDNKTIMCKLDFFGAFMDNELIGIIAISDKTHLTLLFTKKEYHRKGVAKSLFNYILKIVECKIITVNSSPYAVEIYHKLGFTDVANEKEVDGIRFTSMQYQL